MRIIVVQHRKSFVCPEVERGKDKNEAFAQAANKVITKKQAQVRVPRGGMRGRVMRRW